MAKPAELGSDDIVIARKGDAKGIDPSSATTARGRPTPLPHAVVRSARHTAHIFQVRIGVHS